MSSSSCLSGTSSCRLAAIVSASFEGSSVRIADATVSTFSDCCSFTYCSNSDVTRCTSCSICGVISGRGLATFTVATKNPSESLISTARARSIPSTRTLMLPSGMRTLCTMLPTVPTWKISSGRGSSTRASCCVARKILRSPFSASSRARTLDSRPTTNGVIMWGKITMSRMGIMGNLRSSFRSRLSFDGWLTGFLSRLRSSDDCNGSCS